MKVHVANHPLISHKLTVLRDEKTDSPTFRRLVEELVTLLAYEATRDVKTTTVTIKVHPSSRDFCKRDAALRIATISA